jgi:hypothetical protein
MQPSSQPKLCHTNLTKLTLTTRLTSLSSRRKSEMMMALSLLALATSRLPRPNLGRPSQTLPSVAFPHIFLMITITLKRSKLRRYSTTTPSSRINPSPNSPKKRRPSAPLSKFTVRTSLSQPENQRTHQNTLSTKSLLNPPCP